MRWVKKQRPEKSGNYLCVIGRYNTMTVLRYSKKHDAFNCFDESEDKKYEIRVKYWAPLPPLPAGLKGFE